MTGYCVKCRKKGKMSVATKTKVRGRTFYKGRCPTCGTRMSRIGG